MGQLTPYTNLLLILKDHGADVDLSNAFTTIEWSETIPQSIKVTLSAAFGKFLTSGEKIQHNDRLYLEYEGVNGNIEKDVFQVKNINRKRLGATGIELVLTCPHQSEYLWKRTITLTSRRSSNFTTLEKVIAHLNLNKGSADPTVLSPTFDIITKTGNNLSTGTFNDFFFNTKKLKDVFNEIAEIEGQPREGQGNFQPPYIRFKSNYDHDADTGLDEVNIQAYAQGFNKNTVSATFTNIPNVTLSHYPRDNANVNLNNILTMETDEDPERATNIILRCNLQAGDYLGDWTKYQGARDFFNKILLFDGTIDYQRGSLVVGSDGLVYEGIIDSTNQPPPNGTFWIQRTFSKPADYVNITTYSKDNLVVFEKIAWKSQIDSNTGNTPGTDEEIWVRVFYVPSVDYSPETKQRPQDWINSLAGAKHADLDTGQTRIIGPNVIIEDDLHPRTYVRFVQTDPSLIPAELKFGGTRIPDAFKMLVIDPATGIETGAGDFAGNDPVGIPFAGNIAQFVDPELDGTGKWFVFLSEQTNQDQEVVDIYEGDSWVKNPCQGTGAFVDGTGTCQIGSRGTIWIKGSYQIIDFLDLTNIIPLFGDLAALTQFGQFVVDRPFECLHRVKYDDTNSRVEVGNTSILSDDVDLDSAVFIKTEPDATPSATQLFDWNKMIGANFWATNPVSSNNVPYGGSTTMGEIVALSTFDFNNMNRGPDGSLEIFGPKIETRYPIQNFSAWIKFITTFGSGSILENTIDSKGDYSFGIFMVDRNDKMRIIDDITIGKSNEVLAINGKLPGKQYKGVPGIPLFFAGKEPDSTDAFDPKEFVFGGIFSKNSFDPQGRYLTSTNPFLLKSELELDIDGWRKAKPLIVTNLDVSTSLPSRNIESQTIDNKSVFRYPQAKNLVLGLEKLYTFKRQEFDVFTSGRSKVDLRHGDPVYITDPETIDDTTDTLPNTLKAVIDKITRTFSKTPNGPGALEEKYSVITRLFPEEA